MGKRFQFEMSFNLRVLQVYMALSALCSVFIVVGLGIITGPNTVFLKNPFSLIFCGLTFWSLNFTYSYFKNSIIASDLFYLFISQYFCLLAMSTNLASAGLHYMSVFPVLALMFTLYCRFDLTRKQKRSQIFQAMGIVVLTFYLPLFSKSFEASALNIVIVSSFLAWQLGVAYLASMSKSKKIKEHIIDPLSEERYFFHDIINHTHALGLSLRYKMLNEKGLDSHEVEAFANELSSLQNLIQDHFGFGHRNLNNENVFYIKDLVRSTKATLFSFMPSNEVDSYVGIRMSGPYESEFWATQNIRINFVMWHRIITNMIKNASEASAKRFELVFDIGMDTLKVTAINDLYRVQNNKYELGQSLAKIITNTSSSEPVESAGVGLESIEQMCLENDGQFELSIKDGMWLISVEVPFNTGDRRVKDLDNEDSKPLNLHKKAS